jgi:lipopolysaccharide biosynthesis glycosyltransferase
MTAGADQSGFFHVTCAADANYGPYAGIAMSSFLKNNPDRHTHLHLLSDGIKARDLAKFEKLAVRFGSELSIYDIGKELDRIPNLPRRVHHLSRTMFARLLFPELLSPNIDCALYLDCDVVCVSRLKEFHRLSKTIDLIGGVRDPWIDADTKHKRLLGMAPENAYINSGVLLVNVGAWCREGVTEKLIHFLAGPTRTPDGLPLLDQDVINGVLWERITELPEDWNTLVSHPASHELEERFSRAANLHFCGGFKPWHLGYGLARGTQLTAYKRAKFHSPWRWTLADMQFGRMKKWIRQRAVARNPRLPLKTEQQRT